MGLRRWTVFTRPAPACCSRMFLGIRYKGTLGTAWTYLSPQDSELKQSIWPQGAISFPGQMIQAEALPEAQVLATVTLPFVDPKVGNCINVRFAQIWNNPPALRVGADPGIVIHPFGQGKAIWLAAPIEAGDYAVNAKVVSALLRRVFRGPTISRLPLTNQLK